MLHLCYVYTVCLKKPAVTINITRVLNLAYNQLRSFHNNGSL